VSALMPSQPSQTDEPAGSGQQIDAPVRPPLVEALRAISWHEPKTAWRQLVALVGLSKLIAVGVMVLLVLAALLLSGGEHVDPVAEGTGTLNYMLWFGAVLALMYVSLAALKRYTAGTMRQRGALLDVLDSKALGPNRSVYVVRAGDKRLVLGVTQHQITTLAELKVEPEIATALEIPPGLEIDDDLSFEAHLQRAETDPAGERIAASAQSVD